MPGTNYKKRMIPEHLTDGIPHEEGPVHPILDDHQFLGDLSMDLCCSKTSI